MHFPTLFTTIATYGVSVALGVYLASGNGPTVTALFVLLSLFATGMARRHRGPATAGAAVEHEAAERARPARIRTYEVEQSRDDTPNGDSRIPFYLSDADLFSRAS